MSNIDSNSNAISDLNLPSLYKLSFIFDSAYTYAVKFNMTMYAEHDKQIKIHNSSSSDTHR